jgi:hypothetical protein
VLEVSRLSARLEVSVIFLSGMNRKLFLVATLAVFAQLAIFGWLLNGVVLSELYGITKGIWRTEEARSALLPLLFVNYFVVSSVFVSLFIRGYRNKGWAEGVRYGLVFGMLIATLISIERFVMLEIPVQLAVGWFMGTLFGYMIMGLTVAMIYKEPE